MHDVTGFTHSNHRCAKPQLRGHMPLRLTLIDTIDYVTGIGTLETSILPVQKLRALSVTTSAHIQNHSNW